MVRPAAHVRLYGESPLIACSEEDLATRQSQGGNKLMKEADSKASARRTADMRRVDNESYPIQLTQY